MTRPGDLHVVVVIATAIAVALYLVQGASAQAWTSFVTKADFDQRLFPGHLDFYSYEALKAASTSSGFNAFGSSPNEDDRKRELAAFLAHVKHESGGLTKKYEENVPATTNYCDGQYPQYPCAAGKRYVGRGALQLTWNYNYGRCGQYLGLNLLNDPGLALRDGETSFKTALWFWMINVGRQGITAHDAIVNRRSFSGSIQAINGYLECAGPGQTDVGRRQMMNRVTYYRDFCQKLNVQPGNDLQC